MFDLKARRSHANKAKLNRDNIIYDINDIIYISVWRTIYASEVRIHIIIYIFLYILVYG